MHTLRTRPRRGGHGPVSLAVRLTAPFMGAHTPLLRFLRLLLLGAMFLSPGGARAHKEYVHQYLAIEAYRLLIDRHPRLAAGPFAAHIGTQTGECEGFQFTEGLIARGAYREDCEDPVFHYGDVIPGLDNAYFSASHFWDADAGDGSAIRICDLTCGEYENAYRKTLRYVLPGEYGRWTARLTWPPGISHFNLQQGGTDYVYHNGLLGFEYDELAAFYRDGRCEITGYMDISGRWQTASTVPDQLPLRIVAPQNVRDRIAWEVIGRIAHLIGDMGVPAHAHNDIHPPFWWNNEPADVFEEEMATLHTAWTYRDAKAQGHLLDTRAANPEELTWRAMRYLLYATNQVADRFPSNDGDGDLAYDTEWGGDDYAALNIIATVTTDPGARNVFHREAADVAFVFSIRAIAGLYEWFARETGILATVSVAADFPGAVLLLDGKPVNAPFDFTLPAGTEFSLEARSQSAAAPPGEGSCTMVFRSWEIRRPDGAIQETADAAIDEETEHGAQYLARFDREIGVELAGPRHLDGGNGGTYTVGGSAVGASWSSRVNLAETPTLTVGMIPPPGSVFLCWDDGVRSNPRELRPEGNVTLRAWCKQRMTSGGTPSVRRPGQRRIARTGLAGPGAVTAVLVYESGGDIYYSESLNGTSWSTEELVSAGAGNARNPAIDYRSGNSEAGSGAYVVWEESAGGGRIIRGRSRQEENGAWVSPVTLHEDPAAAADLFPVLSADLVAWQSASGIMVKQMAGAGPILVPGTDVNSRLPVLDFYDHSAGGFAVAWIQSGANVVFRRAVLAGPAWTSAVTAAVAAAGETITSVDLAIAVTGNGCVAWSAGSSGGPRIHYRQFDASGVLQPAAAMHSCPLPEGSAPMLAHHRQDSELSRDFELLAWTPLPGEMAALFLRGPARQGPSRIALQWGAPELPRSSPGLGSPIPAYCFGQASGGHRPVIPVLIAHAPLLPAPPTLESPAAGSAVSLPSAQLVWACSPDADTYALQVSRNASFEQPLVAERTGLTGRSFTVSNLDPGVTYYWRVCAVNALGAGNYTVPRSFSTAAGPPPPTLSGTVVPGGSGPHPRLSWTSPAGAVSFRLYRYICSDADACAAASTRPSLIYEGTSTAFVDGSTIVGSKSVSSRANYYVAAKNADGFASKPSNTVTFGIQSGFVWSTGAALPDPPPTDGLGMNYPNPFNPVTTIPYRVAAAASVSLSVFNVLGQRVAVLFEGRREPGAYAAVWDAGGAPSGLYIVALDIDPRGGGRSFRERRKILLMK